MSVAMNFDPLPFICLELNSQETTGYGKAIAIKIKREIEKVMG